MAGTVKKLQFSEGTDVGAPTDLSLATSTTFLEPYANDAAYVAANGAAANGSAYVNTTKKAAQFYAGGAWRGAPVVQGYEDYPNASAPATPASGLTRVYSKTDKQMYQKDDAGIESALGGGATSSAMPQNFLYNAGFDYWQDGLSVAVAAGVTKYVAARWYVQSAFDGPGALSVDAGGGAVNGSFRSLELSSTVSPTTAVANAGFLYQTLDNRTSRLLYNQQASFSAQIMAVGNVTQIGLLFLYNTSEAKANMDIGSETLVTINAGSYTLCQIINQAIGTAMTTSGVIGIRIRATAVSAGDVSDAGNGFVIEQAGVYLGNPATVWQRMHHDITSEKAACDRFRQTSYAADIAPGATVTDTGEGSATQDFGAAVLCNSVRMVEKRVVPTVDVYAPDGTISEAEQLSAGGGTASAAATATRITSRSFVVQGANTAFYRYDWVADAEI